MRGVLPYLVVGWIALAVAYGWWESLLAPVVAEYEDGRVARGGAPFPSRGWQRYRATGGGGFFATGVPARFGLPWWFWLVMAAMWTALTVATGRFSNPTAAVFEAIPVALLIGLAAYFGLGRWGKSASRLHAAVFAKGEARAALIAAALDADPELKEGTAS
ncbi:MAG: hypothetical protein Q7W30_02825 [Coriobacteriia bacterium]|nr:hypothetical protein [Coriobacteriia bacterium]